MADEGYRIVVVDDDPGMNQALSRLFSAAGYQVITFPSAEALLEAGVARTAAGLVFDIHLPGFSGFDLHRKLSEGGVLPPVVFITAYDEVETRCEASQLGAIACFIKPFSGRNLVAAITGAIDRNAARRLADPE